MAPRTMIEGAQIAKPEHLVGRKWTCPALRCGKQVEITTNGIFHAGKGHWFMYTLDDLFDMHLMDLKFKKALFYGDNID